MKYTYTTWLVGSSDQHNLVITTRSGNSLPAPVGLAKAKRLTFTWSGLNASKSYLGLVVYDDGTTGVGYTVVSVG